MSASGSPAGNPSTGIAAKALKTSQTVCARVDSLRAAGASEVSPLEDASLSIERKHWLASSTRIAAS
jgi:hypothetical protein